MSIFEGVASNPEMNISGKVELEINEDETTANLIIVNLSPHSLDNPNPIITGLLLNLGRPFDSEKKQLEICIGPYREAGGWYCAPNEEPVSGDGSGKPVGQFDYKTKNLGDFQYYVELEDTLQWMDTIELSISVINPDAHPNLRFNTDTILNAPSAKGGVFQAALLFKNLGAQGKNHSYLGFNFKQTSEAKIIPGSWEGPNVYHVYGQLDNKKGIKVAVSANLGCDITSDSGIIDSNSLEQLIYDGKTPAGQINGEIEVKSKETIRKYKFHSDKPTYMHIRLATDLMVTFKDVTVEYPGTGEKSMNCNLLFAALPMENSPTWYGVIKVFRPGKPEITIFGVFEGSYLSSGLL